MPLTLELPPALEEELQEEATKEGVPASDHAILLLYLATALLEESETTPFRDAVRAFLSYRSIDTHRVASVFEELVRECLGKWKGTSSDIVLRNLREWRNRYVHQPSDVPSEKTSLSLPSKKEPKRRKDRPRREGTALGKYAHISGSSEEFAADKQEDTIREDSERS